MFEGHSFIILMENIDRKCLILEKTKEPKEMATIGNR